MKKVMILSVAVAALGLATPQISQAHRANSKVVVMQDQEVKYQEIKTEELPEAVSTAISKDYSTYTVDQAFKGDDGSFKVTVSNGTKKYVLFYSENGDLKKVEEPSGKSELPPKN